MCFRKKKKTAQAAKSAPAPAPAPKPVNTVLPREMYFQLADEYAHYCSITLEDDPEQKEREKKLLAGGGTAQAVIAEYLAGCARGQRSYGWWQRAADLTRMIRKLDASQAERYLSDLKAISTNIWEYHTQVIQVAVQELLELKKASPRYDGSVIPPEDAEAELIKLNGSGKSPDEIIRGAIEMLPSVEDWADKDKAFYYYVIAEAIRKKNPDDPRCTAFYSAQVYYNPVGTSLGWYEMGRMNVPEVKELGISFETAQVLVKKYPLPDTLEELLD